MPPGPPAHLKAHRTAASLRKKADVPAALDTQGGLNSKLHAVCDGQGTPIILLLTKGGISEHSGARLVIEKLPASTILIGDRGYDSDHFRAGLNERGIKARIPPAKNRKQPIDYDGALPIAP